MHAAHVMHAESQLERGSVRVNDHGTTASHDTPPSQKLLAAVRRLALT
mgnify:CR=1